jgi:hypothetical protein
MRSNSSGKKRRSADGTGYPNIIEEPIRVVPEPKGAAGQRKAKKPSKKPRQKPRS